MKKIILLLAVIFSSAVMFTACKEGKKEVKTEAHEHDGHDHDKKEVASKDVYQCPMDCEKGKTYTKEGSCPECKMDLKVKLTDNMEVKHADNCKCKEGGECTCEGGICECQKEATSMTKECTKCELGSCECKA